MKNLPKFLYSRLGDQHFIFHNNFPRFAGEAIKKGNAYEIQPEMIDTFPVKDGDEQVLASLLREAGDFFSSQNFIDEKISKFLLCENPLLDERHDGRTFILHTREPMALTEIQHYEDDLDAAQKKYEDTDNAVLLSYGIESIVIYPLWIDQNQVRDERIGKLMKAIADWYHAYLIWEDAQDFEGDDNE